MQNRGLYLTHIVVLASLSIGFMSPGGEGCESCNESPSFSSFSISLSPTTSLIPPGGTGKGTITVTRVAGYVDNIVLKVDEQVSWARFTFVPETLGVHTSMSSFLIDVDAQAPLAFQNFTIRGVSARDTNLLAVDYGSIRVVAADAGWYPLASGTSSNLFDVVMTGPDGFGLAAGDNGTILRTTGGLPWGPVASGITTLLYTVRRNTGSSSVVAVGNNGTILNSENFGASWMSQVSGTSENLWSASIVNENVRTVVGGNGTILRTTNGGATWLPQTSGTTRQLNGVSFISPGVGIVVGNGGAILRTDNEGATWMASPPPSEVNLYDVAMISPITAVAVGIGGLIVRSTNAGANWSPTASGTTQGLYRLSFADEDTGVCVGQNGTIIKTTNGGITWVPESIQVISPPMPVLYGVFMISGDDGFAVGSGGTILRRQTGGKRTINSDSHDINRGNANNQTRRNTR